MRRSEQPPEGCGSPGCPDLLRYEESLPPPVYRSFFEEECRAIIGRLRLGTPQEPSPGPWEGSDPWPDAIGLLTSTPLRTLPLLDGGAPDSGTPAARRAAGGCGASVAAPAPAREEPRRPPEPAAGRCPGAAPPGSRLPRKAARRWAGQQACGAPGPAGLLLTSGRSPGPRGGGRGSLLRAGAGGRNLELPKAGKGLGAPGTRPPRSSGAKPKLMPAAKSRLQHPSGASQLTRPSAVLKAASRARETEGLPAPKLICNRTWELKESSESKEQLVAAGTVLGAGKADQTWVCVGSSFSSDLAPGLTPGCGAAVPAEQSAGDQLSQELKHLKNELEQVKGELADKTAQCEAYRQTISSLQVQLRAAGICPEDAAVEESGDLRRD